MKDLYEEYLICFIDGTYTYRKSYKDALNLSRENNNSTIYGAKWFKTKFSGLLQKQWEKINY